MSAFKAVVVAGIVLLAVPVLLTPAGWPIALALIAIFLVVAYVVRYLLDLEKYRRQGERAGYADLRHGRNE